MNRSGDGVPAAVDRYEQLTPTVEFRIGDIDDGIEAAARGLPVDDGNGAGVRVRHVDASRGPVDGHTEWVSPSPKSSYGRFDQVRRAVDHGDRAVTGVQDVDPVRILV